MSKGATIKWIDLNVLPKRKSVIDWERSVGCRVPFQYDDIKSEVCIVGYERWKSMSYIDITVDKYINEPYRLQATALKLCPFTYLLANRIIDKFPEIIPYLANPDDAYKYSYQSNKKVKFKCPFCGKESEQYLNNIYKRGFSCECFSDGVSLPNKIMSNILTQLKIPYKREVGATVFSWIGEYYYDFYFNVGTKQNILVEMDGRYHDEDDCAERDKIKDRLAKENGFKLIRIDCKYRGDPIQYIKNNVINSELKDILDLNDINWNQCKEVYKTKMMLAACELWENTLMTITDIANKLQMDNRTIAKYLKRGVILGMCPSYSYAEAQSRNSSRQIAIIDNGDILRVFFNSEECATTLQNEIGTRFTAKGVLNCVYGYNKSYRGYQFKHITKEEYKQCKMINNNEVVLKEAII